MNPLAPAFGEPPPRPRVAIMQPTFLPWLGYFALMDAADIFVFLDNVQLTRRSWQVRNRLKGAQGEVMLSVELQGRPSRPMIADARLAETDFAERISTTVGHLLSRAPHYPVVEGLLKSGFARAQGSLCALNIALIEGIAAAAGITTPCLHASSLELETEARGSRLRAICETLGAATYVSPPGAGDYLAEDAPFGGSTIALRFFEYVHPEYPQFHPPFLPYMAAIDALAHVGGDGLRALISKDHYRL